MTTRLDFIEMQKVSQCDADLRALIAHSYLKALWLTVSPPVIVTVIKTRAVDFPAHSYTHIWWKEPYDEEWTCAVPSHHLVMLPHPATDAALGDEEE